MTIMTSSAKRCAGPAFVCILVGITLYFAFAFPMHLFRHHANAYRQRDGTQLLAVQVVMRHGDKAPSARSYFPSEENAKRRQQQSDQQQPLEQSDQQQGQQYDNQQSEPFEGFDQLTNSGKLRMFSIGKYLRYRYYEHLRGSPRALYMRSSDTDRCIESAMAMAAGLLPAHGQWQWWQTTADSSSGQSIDDHQIELNPLVAWQPVPVHTREHAVDPLLWPYADCGNAELEASAVRNTTRYRQVANEFQHDLELLRQYTGRSTLGEDPLLEAERINDAMQSRTHYQRWSRSSTKDDHERQTMPTWYTTTFAKRLAHIANVVDRVRFSSDTMLRLRAGPLLYRLLEKFHSVVMGGDDTSSTSNWAHDQRVKMHVYVTHDQVLTALMNALNIYTGVPGYGTALIMELYYDTTEREHFVDFFHMSDGAEPELVPEPIRVHPSACGEQATCPLERVSQNLQHLTLDEGSWRQACQQQAPVKGEPQPPIEPIPVKPTTIDNNEQTSTTAHVPTMTRLDDGSLPSTIPIEIVSIVSTTTAKPTTPMPTTSDVPVPSSTEAFTTSSSNDSLKVAPNEAQTESGTTDEPTSTSTTLEPVVSTSEESNGSNSNNVTIPEVIGASSVATLLTTDPVNNSLDNTTTTLANQSSPASEGGNDQLAAQTEQQLTLQLPNAIGTDQLASIDETTHGGVLDEESHELRSHESPRVPTSAVPGPIADLDVVESLDSIELEDGRRQRHDKFHFMPRAMKAPNVDQRK